MRSYYTSSKFDEIIISFEFYRVFDLTFQLFYFKSK